MNVCFTLLGAFLVAGGFVEVAILAARGEAKLWNIVALGFLAVLSGATVANLTDVTDVLISLGGANSLHFQRVVEHVDNQVDEVKKLTDRVQRSEQNVASLADKVQRSETNVAKMQADVAKMQKDVKFAIANAESGL